MAVAVHPSLAPRSKTYRQAKRVREPIPRGERLPLHHQQDLQDIARGVEETCAGIATKYLMNGDDAGDHEDVKLEDVEKMCDRFNVLGGSPAGGWLSRVKRARRALRAMREVGYHREVATLHVAYGPEDPSTRAWSRTVREYLGAELLGLVRYTDTTEERRKKLVRIEAMAQRMTLANLGGLGELRNVISLSRAREREAYFDRIITSGDALADAMAPFDGDKPHRADDETREGYALRLRPYDERAASHLARRAEFMLAAKVDAETMLITASRLYHRAWLSTPA